MDLSIHFIFYKDEQKYSLARASRSAIGVLVFTVSETFIFPITEYNSVINLCKE